MQRVDILLDNALKNAREDMDLAQRQASIARRLCMKFNIRLPYEKRQLFCRGCKNFIVPGINARVRLKNKPRAIRITCLECGHVYRKGIDRKS
ncbi:MAG: RNase P subunit [archaeon]|nr:RNase P subunit [archaeon]MCP8305824.1 RNase P subunit [archaeon]